MAQNAPLLSVVIRAYNSWATTREIIALLADPRVERILVDSGSSDLPPDIGTLVEKVVHYQCRPFSYGGSLNAGIAAARGVWTWVLSSHCVPSRKDVIDQIEKLTTHVADDVVCILGKTFPPGRKPEELDANSPGYTLVENGDFPGGNPNCLYRTASLLRRPFDERIITCEDIEWFIAARDAGARVAASRCFPVLYRTQRPVSVMFRKGLDEYRVGKCLGKPRPRVGWKIVERLTRNFAKVLLRRLALADFLRKEAYILGYFVAENLLAPWTQAQIRRPATQLSSAQSAVLPGAPRTLAATSR
jgi:glycosyltransferase involved in cell wall biosynthesis